MAHALIGFQAPTATLFDVDGQPYVVNEGGAGLGIPLVLVFYPRAGSYGCTKEVCSFRDAIEGKGVFHPDKVKIIGISGDPVKKQKNWSEKQHLNFPVMSDSTGDARKAYQVGRSLLGLVDARVTFVIDGKGIVRDVLDSTLNFAAHVQFVQGCLERMSKAGS